MITKINKKKYCCNINLSILKMYGLVYSLYTTLFSACLQMKMCETILKFSIIFYYIGLLMLYLKSGIYYKLIRPLF